MLCCPFRARGFCRGIFEPAFSIDRVNPSIIEGAIMAIERTFAIIKPNAVQAGNMGQIISEIERSGLAVRGMRLARLTPEICQEFYQEHVAKPFYPELEAFMTEGPVVLMCLEGEGAILRWRDLMGATDPAKAAPGTLRARFAKDMTRNATHGSDSPASAQRELGFFFGAYDLV
jgi:nucleoside-diphosphate kinase